MTNHRSTVLHSLLGLLAASVLGATEWRQLETDERCVGGGGCGRFETVRLELEAKPVEAIRFKAHDDVGRLYDGRVRVRIDDRVLEELALDRKSRPYRVNGGDRVGRWLIFEPASDDEIIISRIEVGYRSEGDGDRGTREWDDRRPETRRDDPRWDDRRPDPREEGRRGEGRRDDSRWEDSGRDEEGGRRSGSEASAELRLRGWEGSGDGSRLAYLEEVGCVGGQRCRNTSITVRFRRPARVGEIRFFAHDNLGEASRGRLRVTLDGEVLAEDLDVPASGHTFELSGRGRLAGGLTFEPVTHEEVLVKDLMVFEADDRYGAQRPRDDRRFEERRDDRSGRRYDERETRPLPPGVDLREGAVCLGGDLCGRRWSLELPMAGGVSALRFFSHADLGRGFGRLKVVTDRGDSLREIEVDRRGDFYAVAVPDGTYGVRLEAVEGDLVVEELELQVGDGWERYRGEEPR